eukprot:TRINITY_DN2986_c0_g1_i1.p1 TRINITY_DN2986_c0_g1~~TRINITY_DN2986_c0_g1_i1.p1  ORF type:complete len:263 (-),score=44.34 TRINITY_DN2986_c0_g1_i1:53-841(-)
MDGQACESFKSNGKNGQCSNCNLYELAHLKTTLKLKKKATQNRTSIMGIHKLKPKETTDPQTVETKQPVPEVKIQQNCSHCGEPLEEKAKFCSSCGVSHQNPEEAHFKHRRSFIMSKELMPNAIEQKCDACHKVLPFDSEIIVFNTKFFHQGCFCCAKCKKVFGPDETYYEKKGEPYCNADFSSTSMVGTCKGCLKSLGIGKFVEVRNTCWHPQCFQCKRCQVSFEGGKTCLWVDEQPYCEGCGRRAFVEYYANRRRQRNVK